MIQAMTSGHAGSMSTIHANTALDTLNRLETLALMSKVELPLHALRSQIASAIDLVVLMNRLSEGNRVVTEVAEVLPLGDDGHYKVRRMFEYGLVEGPDGQAVSQLRWLGEPSTFADHPKVRLQRSSFGQAGAILAAEGNDSK